MPNDSRKEGSKTIGLEAAKLLGVPFAWPGYRPHRFVREKEEYVLQLWFHDLGWMTIHNPLWRSWRLPGEDPVVLEEKDFLVWVLYDLTYEEACARFGGEACARFGGQDAKDKY